MPSLADISVMGCSAQNNSLTKDIFQRNTLFVSAFSNCTEKIPDKNFSKLEGNVTVKLLRSAQLHVSIQILTCSDSASPYASKYIRTVSTGVWA